LYLVLANYGPDRVEVQTTEAYVPAADPSAAPSNRYTVDGRSLRILRRSPG